MAVLPSNKDPLNHALPSPQPPLSNASNVILVDNYDSFTWNLYQYLVLEGASVTVYRNDELTLKELIVKSPTQLIASPGPGHPSIASDVGITCEAISYFSGKIPVLGVCMGEQCIFSVFGGQVDVTGEILHGKTSPLRHDSKGVYANLPQDLPVTRYHSLAGTHATLPDCLEVSSWIASGPDGGKGIIMGVRHKDLLVEGVQFHPESILTAEGRSMLKNFLNMKGGTWKENERLQRDVIVTNDNHTEVGHHDSEGLAVDSPLGPKLHVMQESVLEKIFRERRTAISAQKLLPSQRPSDLEAAYTLNLAPPQISFPGRLKQTPYSLSLMAEIKRASPSKGVISLSACAPEQARKYALAGASVISVLTEPRYFKGSLDDLRAVRQSLEGMPHRPAILCKDFIFERYQILEARLAGADTVLLIVKMLDEEILRNLYHYSKSLGMEPLVEINTAEEATIANNLGAEVVGVNNRNLTNFEVDLGTTSLLMDNILEGTIVCALSGIARPADVEVYKRSRVSAVLVGESLMRASDTTAFVHELLGDSMNGVSKTICSDLLVKICGTRTAEAARVAVEAGADMIGIILVEGRRRYVPREMALTISRVVHETPKSRQASRMTFSPRDSLKAIEYFDFTTTYFERANHTMLVGVFQDQPLSYILEQQALLGLDIVQLHGSEPIEWARAIPVPVIRKFGINDLGLGKRGYHALPLLDSATGGSGQALDVDAVRRILNMDPGLRVFLAGGLNPENVGNTIKQLSTCGHQVVAVDVSSGVEEEGVQSLAKIRAFVQASKRLRLRS